MACPRAAADGGIPLRLFALTLATLIAATALVGLAPAGAAVSHCTSLLNDLTTTDCQHFVCVGRSTSTSYGYTRERCKLSEENVPHPCGPTMYCECTCPPMRAAFLP